MEEMDADTVQWLKRRYSDAPPQKKVKFSQIHEELACQFPSTKFNSLTVSKMIRKAFPNAESRPFGRGHQRYFFGLQELEQAHCSSTDDLSKEELRLKLEEERSRRTELELKLKVAEEKVHEMERTMFTSTSLERQLDTITTPCFKIYHGPDSVSHFDDFSIDSMISEVKQHAPDLLQLLSSLGRAPTLMGQPSVEDADHLMKRAKSFLMEFLAHEFTDLADLKPFVPEHQSPHPVCKSEVVPMKVLFKDEKYTAETIDILSQLMIDANLNCDPQVCTLIMSTCMCH